MGEIMNTYKIPAENPVGQIQLGGLEVGGRLMLKFVVKKYDINLWTEFVCFRIRTRVGPSERFNISFNF